jgi:hypothetical protein
MAKREGKRKLKHGRSTGSKNIGKMTFALELTIISRQIEGTTEGSSTSALRIEWDLHEIAT